MEKLYTHLNAAIQYQVIGQGPNVVLIHGFGEDSSIWADQIQFLKSHCTLIIPDLPGTGKSELLLGAQISIVDYADSIHQLLVNEKVDKVIMLGHSMGGYITLAFAEKYPTYLTAFGLIHSTAFADSEEKKNTRRKGIEFIKEYGSYAFIKNTIPNLFSDNFKKNSSQRIQAMIEAGKNFSADSLIQYFTAMMNRPDRTHVLQNATIPVLFIVGDQDKAAPLDDLKKQIHLPQKPYIHILEDVGHMGMLEATEKLNKHMLEFINR